MKTIIDAYFPGLMYICFAFFALLLGNGDEIFLKIASIVCYGIGLLVLPKKCPDIDNLIKENSK